MESTSTARESSRDPSGSLVVSGGVSDCVSELARFLLCEIGDAGSHGGVFSKVAAMLCENAELGEKTAEDGCNIDNCPTDMAGE